MVKLWIIGFIMALNTCSLLADGKDIFKLGRCDKNFDGVPSEECDPDIAG